MSDDLDLPDFLDRRPKKPAPLSPAAVKAAANRAEERASAARVTAELPVGEVLPPTETQPVARPLDELVRLIQKQLRLGQEAAERAAAPHWLELGKLLHEAKAQLAHGEFGDWCKRHFKIGTTQRARYMKAAESAVQNFRNGKFDSLEDHLRGTSYANGAKAHDPVKQIVGTINVESLRHDALERAEVRKRQERLAMKLIDRGYKALAAEMHPDKGGSTEAMADLNCVRKRLKQYI
jgi:hypothetical protein